MTNKDRKSVVMQLMATPNVQSPYNLQAGDAAPRRVDSLINTDNTPIASVDTIDQYVGPTRIKSPRGPIHSTVTISRLDFCEAVCTLCTKQARQAVNDRHDTCQT